MIRRRTRWLVVSLGGAIAGAVSWGLVIRRRTLLVVLEASAWPGMISERVVGEHEQSRMARMRAA